MGELKKIGMTLLIILGFLMILLVGSGVIDSIFNSKLMILIWFIVGTKMFFKLIKKD